MDPNQMSDLLAPFAGTKLAPAQLESLNVYLELLLRWNARLNLTAVRDAEHIVTRHFGESLFAAAHLLGPVCGGPVRAIDVGSGPGFPGLPMKVLFPALRLTLIEAQHKKATFLREVIRALGLKDTDVFAGRAQDFPDPAGGDLVTLRAVERFEEILPVAACLLRRADMGPALSPADRQGEANGATPAVPRLGLLIGASQASRARQLAPNLRWDDPVSIPQSSARILLAGSAASI